MEVHSIMATDTKESDVPAELRKLSIHAEHAEEIAEAVAVEHTLSFWEAVKLYPKAIGWSMYFSMGVIMLCMRIYVPSSIFIDSDLARSFRSTASG